MKNISKIGIIGYFGHDNAGDEAMKELLIGQFSNSVASNCGKIEKCDAYIIAGGDLITEFSGLYMSELWEGITNEPCYALSLGVKKGWEIKKDIALKCLKKFRKIYTREQESFEILSQYVKVDGIMPDLVFLADAPKAQEQYPILFNYTDRPWVEPNGQFEDIMKNSEVLPIGLAPEFDSRYANKIVTYQEFISMAKSSKGVIGTRLHAVVMGVIADVPVAGIAYENKVRKFCDRYNIPCFDYGLQNGQEIIHSLKKSHD